MQQQPQQQQRCYLGCSEEAALAVRGLTRARGCNRQRWQWGLLTPAERCVPAVDCKQDLGGSRRSHCSSLAWWTCGWRLSPAAQERRNCCKLVGAQRQRRFRCGSVRRSYVQRSRLRHYLCVSHLFQHFRNGVFFPLRSAQEAADRGRQDLA